MKKLLDTLFLIIFFAMLLVSCQQKTATQIPQVLNTYSHDAEAFTQGLGLCRWKIL